MPAPCYSPGERDTARMPLRRLGLVAPVVVAVLLSGAAAGLAGTAAAPSLTLRSRLPALERIGQTVTVAGSADGLPHGSLIVLQGRRSTAWTALAQAHTGTRGRFRLRWHLGSRTDPGPLSLRVVAYRSGAVTARTRPVQSAVGSRYIPCLKPVPPAQNIPVGDGWIVGGVYIQGGPYPGLDQCEDAPYDVTAADSSGSAQASQMIAARHSYTLVVPAGTYGIRATPSAGASGCPGIGQATVEAGRQTVANSYCRVP